jgi:hypothetical protein
MVALVHPIMGSVLPEAEVIMSKGYPLLRELIHKYNLVIMGKRHPFNPDSNSFILSREDGMVIGCAGYNDREGNYFFRSVINPKERGRSSEDRFTYKSVKMPSLMRTIEKHKLIPSDSLTVVNNLSHTSTLVSKVIEKLGNFSKGSGGFSGATIHELLNVAFGYQDLKSLSTDSIVFFKKALDEYNQVDETRKARLNVVKEIFDKPIKFLSYDNTGTFIKGSMCLDVKFDEYHRLDDVKVVKMEAQRVRTFMDDPDIAPRMAMLKVTVQKNSSATEFVGEEGFFPQYAEGYHEDLGIYQVDTDGWRYDNFPSKPQWIFFV